MQHVPNVPLVCSFSHVQRREERINAHCGHMVCNAFLLNCLQYIDSEAAVQSLVLTRGCGRSLDNSTGFFRGPSSRFPFSRNTSPSPQISCDNVATRRIVKCTKNHCHHKTSARNQTMQNMEHNCHKNTRTKHHKTC